MPVESSHIPITLATLDGPPPAMSEDQFLVERRLIHRTIHSAALEIGRALGRIYDGDGWRWHYVSFNAYLEAEFGKRARGYQLKRYADVVDRALEQLAFDARNVRADDFNNRLPPERLARELVKHHGQERAVTMIAEALVTGQRPAYPSEEQGAQALPPPPPPPTKSTLKRLSRDQLQAALEALTNVDPNFSRAMILNIDRDQTQALIEEAIATLDLVRDYLDEHGGGR